MALSFSLVGALAHAQGTATVQDPATPGLLGDSLLSLDEAIQLANGTLTIAQLSSGEAGQVQGSSVNRIEFAVSTVIVTANPTAVASGTALTIDGRVPGVAGARLRLVAAAPPANALLVSNSPALTVRNVLFDGGSVGMQVQQPNGGLMSRGLIEDCLFTRQGSIALELIADPAAGNRSGLSINRTEFRDTPIAINIRDTSVAGGAYLISEFLSFERVGVGIDIESSGTGNTSVMQLWRSKMVDSDTLLRMRRAPASSQRQLLRVVHGEFLCRGDVTDVQGADGETVFHHHHATFHAGPGSKAYWVHPRTARFDVHGSENRFIGDVDISANRFTQRIWHENNDYRNGTYRLDNDGGRPEMLWNRFLNFPIEINAAARTPLLMQTCELINSPVNGNSTAGGVTLDTCFLLSAPLSGQVMSINQAPTPWFGTSEVSPEEPKLGSLLRFTSDVPPGMGVVWALGTGLSRPTTTAFPYRFYADPNDIVITLPGLFVLRTTLEFVVPQDPALVGLEFYAQAISVPIFGQSHPPVHLPRGGLIRPKF